MIRLNCLVVGDSGSGKTSLVIVYTTNAIATDYIPAVCNNTAYVMVDGRRFELNIMDIKGDGDVKERIDLYSIADVILVCFDVNVPETFYNVQVKWKKEIELYCPNTPFILLGNKFDIRDNSIYAINQIDENNESYSNYLSKEKSKILIFGYIHKYLKKMYFPNCLMDICYKYYFVAIPITTKQGNKMKETIGATQYIEHNLWSQYCTGVFDAVIRTALTSKHKKKQRCHIM